MAIAQLARRCLYLNGKRRPTMKEVAAELEAIQGSSVQDNLGDTEHHSIVEVSEVYDFASISGSICFDNITTSSSFDVDPLLRMDLKLLLYITFSLLVMAFAVPLSKPNCPEKCGNVIIPYPFGIGQECSANPSFTIDCRNFTNYKRPFLSSLDLQVLEVSLRRGIVIVNQPVSPMNCSTQQKELSLGKSLFRTPFIFSRFYNVLIVLGCKNVVTLLTNETTAGVCMAVCRSSGYTPTDTSCNGVDCCKTNIPQLLQEQQIIYRSSDTNTRFCGYAFLVHEIWLLNDYKKYKGLQVNLSNPFDKKFVFAPVALDWEFPLADFELGICRNRSYYSSDGRILYNSSTMLCLCKNGFDGNPYLKHGCQDIDECSNSNLNFCSYGKTCINKFGYYKCQKGKKSRVQMAFIAIGAGLGALILLVVAWRSYKVIRRRIKANRKQKFFERNGGLLLEQQLSSTQNGVERTKLFSSKELEQATDHFNVNRILGIGGQGTVYKGMLSDGRIVAVKKSQKVDEDDLEVFINEVVILSQINHRNVVKLLGCCLETEVPLLVYEFIPNDTLFQHIHNPTEEFPLTWEMRLRIATEVSLALSYLHSAASVPIYHRDIKSTNILLDDKYRAKVSDFGTSRSVSIDQTHLTTKVIGTFGYLDPEYFQSSQFTEKVTSTALVLSWLSF
ncbi:Wall-associated receptor kinase-like 8 [Forsythia ovata]|uniref:Wall-associated receptor kinase-like 8 n=1 Tax=Forsythia ovata TaxID=205694 RepID=A0ABD1WCE7_9LAMI